MTFTRQGLGLHWANIKAPGTRDVWPWTSRGGGGGIDKARSRDGECCQNCTQAPRLNLVSYDHDSPVPDRMKRESSSQMGERWMLRHRLSLGTSPEQESPFQVYGSDQLQVIQALVHWKTRVRQGGDRGQTRGVGVGGWLGRIEGVKESIST